MSGSRDETIKLWNWSTGECLSTIQANSFIYSLAVIQMNQQQQTTTTPMSSNFSCFLLFLFKKTTISL